MSDETSHCRDGMSYCEPNTTYNTTAMNTSLYDEAVSMFWIRIWILRKGFVKKIVFHFFNCVSCTCHPASFVRLQFNIFLTFQPCTCNVSYNNSNNPNENNNDAITKNLMALFNIEPVVYTVDLEPIFEVTSIMPSNEERYTDSL